MNPRRAEVLSTKRKELIRYVLLLIGHCVIDIYGIELFMNNSQ
jgi:hypothetical protein